MGNEAEREAFEKWADREIGRTWRSTAPGETDRYEDSHTEMAWFAWRAARTTAIPPALSDALARIRDLPHTPGNEFAELAEAKQIARDALISGDRT